MEIPVFQLIQKGSTEWDVIMVVDLFLNRSVMDPNQRDYLPWIVDYDDYYR